MDFSIEAIIFYILLVDSIVANLVVWSKIGEKWYLKNLRIISRYFPPSKGWTTYYLILVIIMGLLIFK